MEKQIVVHTKVTTITYVSRVCTGAEKDGSKRMMLNLRCLNIHIGITSISKWSH